jgi:predicted DCC family thiol-disulfide oxidoreductase YuxK
MSSAPDSSNTRGAPAIPELTVLFDGGCPLCVREVTFLRERDRRRNPGRVQLAFVDIDAPDYDPAAHQNISYREAMGRIHGIDARGTVLRDVAVFRRAYALIGLGWLYAPTDWPLLGPLADGLYGLWARWRLPITRRPNLNQLCSQREHCRVTAAEGPQPGP